MAGIPTDDIYAWRAAVDRLKVIESALGSTPPTGAQLGALNAAILDVTATWDKHLTAVVAWVAGN